MVQTMIESLTNQFQTQFKQAHSSILFSPGRINLLGHHSDFTQGQTLSITIKQGFFAIVALRDDKTVNCFCHKSKSQTIESFHIDELTTSDQSDWIEKLKIIIRKISHVAPFIKQGFDILLDWNIPLDAGLADNAALNTLLTTTVMYLYDLDLTDKTITTIALETDHDFNKPANSYLATYSDYVTISRAHKKYMLYYNDKTASSEYLDFDLGDYRILLIDSMRNRYFNNVKFNERKKECEQALKLLQAHLDIQHLSDLSLSAFERSKHLLNDPVLKNRVRHLVYEQDRVMRGREAILKNDLAFLAELINRSFKSMRDLFELTAIELNIIVDALMEQEGVLCANTTDSRLGGTVMAIVHQDEIEAIQAKIKDVMFEEVGVTPSFQISGLEDRSRLISSH